MEDPHAGPTGRSAGGTAGDARPALHTAPAPHTAPASGPDTTPSVTVSAFGTTATIQLQGAMVTASFDLDGRTVEPLFTAAWHGWHGVPLLEHLRGDFPCVPFGDAPRSLDAYPPAWAALDPGTSPHPHGWSSNGVWHVLPLPSAGAESGAATVGGIATDGGAATAGATASEGEAATEGGAGTGGVARLRLDHPASDAVDWVQREVVCAPGRVEFTDTIHVRRATRLPLGVHPILALPSTPGAARLRLPACQTFATLPVAPEPTSTLAPDARFVDAALAPRADGGTRDLTRLPLEDDTEEIVLVANPTRPRVELDHTEAGYRAYVEWDGRILRHALLWFSNRGRPFEPWGGRNVCLGVEPITAAFDLGESISAGPNPLAAEGIDTAVDLWPGRDLVIRHRVGVEPLP